MTLLVNKGQLPAPSVLAQVLPIAPSHLGDLSTRRIILCISQILGHSLGLEIQGLGVFFVVVCFFLFLLVNVKNLMSLYIRDPSLPLSLS